MDRVPYDEHGPLFDYIRRRDPCIVALWHQDVFPLMFDLFRYTRDYPALFMVSPNRVGQMGTYLLGLFGIDCVAGSKRGRARDAIAELASRARTERRAIFVMADGSRGPARVARWGAVRLSQQTGLPIIAARGWSNRLLTLRGTWMRLVLPKPWGHAVVLSADPLSVTADGDSEEALASARSELERRLNELVEKSDRYFAAQVEPG